MAGYSIEQGVRTTKVVLLYVISPRTRKSSAIVSQTELTHLTAPAKHVISYEQRRLKRDIENNVFTGDPRPEFDAAWKYLLERKPSSPHPIENH